MKRATNFVLICYGIVALIDIFFTFSDYSSLRSFTKPVLMPVLILALWIETGFKIPYTKIFAVGLFFSWLGDVALRWDNYFIHGLGAFLMAHICYLIFMLRIKGNKGLLQFQPLFALPMAVYLVILLFVLNDYLEQLRIPVFIYGVVISIVCIFSMNLFWKTDKKIAALLFFGSLQFVMSDSLLAIHKFIYPFEILPGLVMLTYCSAQLLLTMGVIRYNNLAKPLSI